MTIEERLKALEDRVAQLEGTATSLPTGKKKSTSLREFVNSVKPQTANDTALVIAYFAEIVQGQGFFTNDTIRDGYAEAKLLPPKNFSDIIAKNAKKGYLMMTNSFDAPGKAYVLTNTGEEYIQEMLNSND